MVRTLAGGNVGHSGSGFADGIGIYSLFQSLTDIAMSSSGTLFVADFGNKLIRAVNTLGNPESPILNFIRLIFLDTR